MNALGPNLIRISRQDSFVRLSDIFREGAIGECVAPLDGVDTGDTQWGLLDRRAIVSGVLELGRQRVSIETYAFKLLLELSDAVRHGRDSRQKAQIVST